MQLNDQRKQMTPIMAIANVLNRRQQRGATDESLIRYLEHLKQDIWKSPHMQTVLDGFMDAIRQTPTEMEKLCENS
jgi:hypothetical protein